MVSTGNFKQSMGARNRVGMGLSYRPARLHILADLIPWNRFLGSLKVSKFHGQDARHTVVWQRMENWFLLHPRSLQLSWQVGNLPKKGLSHEKVMVFLHYKVVFSCRARDWFTFHMLVADNLKPKTENSNSLDHAWLDYSASAAGNSLGPKYSRLLIYPDADWFSLVHNCRLLCRKCCHQYSRMCVEYCTVTPMSRLPS
jgi:hypothetical protein